MLIDAAKDYPVIEKLTRKEKKERIARQREELKDIYQKLKNK